MLTAADLKAVADDLRPRVEGGQAQRIYQRLDGTLVFQIWRPVTGATWLVLSADPVAPRLGESAEKGAVPKSPPALAQWARSVCSGRALRGLDHIEGERIVTLRFDEGRIIAELFGRQPNLYGIDREGRVVAMARPSHRPEVATGMPYTPVATRPHSQVSLKVVGSDEAHPARAVEAWAQQRITAHAVAQAERQRAQLIKDTHKRLSRLLARLEADVERHGDAETLQRRGELLKGQLHLVQRGMEMVKVQDWYAEGAPWVEIALDARLDGPENVQRLFARYKKSKAGAARIAERQSQTLEQLITVESIDEAGLSLEETEAALRAAGLLKRRPQGQGKGRAEHAPRRPFRAFTSKAGELIWVGRGGADNHATTFHHARGNDQWLHVRDAAGSHVIAPCPKKGQDPHPETLLDAAALAVHHSKLKGEWPADVMVARRKHVRAVVGAGPGRVTVSESRNITVYDGEARIARLYQG
ncbi:MAG: NFACT RNA binding domain-containing protein [Bradymonadia bacterium]